MPHPTATLLLTRPRGASDRFAAQITPVLPSWVEVVISPLLEIRALPHAIDLARYRAVIFTSAQAIPLVPPGAGRTAFCVGQETTRRAAEAGWDAQCAGATADALVAQISGSNPIGPILHIGGAHRRGDIAARLTVHGIETQEVSVYDQVAIPLSDQAQTALAAQKPVIAPLFSPRTARLFRGNLTEVAQVHIVAMSEAIASELDQMSVRHIWIAKTPDADAMQVAILKAVSWVEAGGAPL